MFRQLSTAALALWRRLATLTPATAQQSKDAGAKKPITNSIGMKLVLIPAGEFKMGSGETAEDTAAFFNKADGSNLLKQLFSRTSTRSTSCGSRVRSTWAPAT